MGKGLALQFKRRWPEVFAKYKAACQDGEVAVGRIFVVRVEGAPLVLNLPTKSHYRDPSRLEDVEAGVCALVDTVRDLGITSIAIPALGCGLGGLSWEHVRPIIEEAFESLPEVHVLLFAPQGAPSGDATIAATLEDLGTRSEIALEILRLCAFFTSDPIPVDVFSTHREAPQPEEVTAAISLLTDLDLARSGGSYLHIASTTQAATRRHLKSEGQVVWARQCARFLAVALPKLEDRQGPTRWPSYRALLHHAMALTDHMERLGIADLFTARIFNQLGYFLTESQCDYAAALVRHQKALSLRQRDLGLDHEDTITSLNNVGFVYFRQGNYDEARVHLQRALDLRVSLYGERHPKVGNSLLNLGGLNERTGDLATALENFRRTLGIFEPLYGCEDSRTATCYNNIGKVLYLQGRLAEAEELLRQALEVRTLRLGSEHPHTVHTQFHLAEWLRRTGDIEHARRLHEQVLEVRRRVLGERHLLTTESLTALRELN